MQIAFSRSYYFNRRHKVDTAESLYGVDLDGIPVSLGYIYQQEDGQWRAEYFDPKVVRIVKTKDEAKNLLFILATQESNNLQFIKGN